MKINRIICLGPCLIWIFFHFGCFFNNVENFDVATASPQEIKNLNAKISFALDDKEENPELKVQFSFNAPNRNRVFLYLPDNFLRKTKLYNRIEDLKLSSQGSIQPFPNRPNMYLIEKPINEPINISYSVRAYDFVKNQKKESFFAPIIREDFFEFVGGMALIFPTFLLGMSTEPKIKFDIKWHMPENFQMYNSFGAQDSSQIINASVNDIKDSLFLGGSNISLKKIIIKGNPVYITIKGKWDHFDDEEITDVITKLLYVQRTTWNDNNFPYFLVALLQFKEECDGIVKFAGTAHVNSFRVYYPKKCPLKPEMKQLISHELMHTWIGKKLRINNGKWFTEGFTDYFGRLLALRANVISLNDYRDLIDKMQNKYFSSSDLEQRPYQDGEILALKLNKQIKAIDESKSLDDVIRDMLYIAKKEGGVKTFSLNEFNDILKKYLPSGIDKTIYNEPHFK